MDILFRNDALFVALNIATIFLVVGAGGLLMYWIPLWIERITWERR